MTEIFLFITASLRHAEVEHETFLHSTCMNVHVQVQEINIAPLSKTKKKQHRALLAENILLVC